MPLARYTKVFLGISFLLFCGCQPDNQSNKINEKVASDTENAKPTENDSSTGSTNLDSDWITAWAITAHQSTDYATLLAKARKLSTVIGWPIDSLGRSYSTELNEIAETDSNSVRYGLYTPRREFGKWISIEQKEFFQSNSHGKAFPGTSGMVILLSLHKNPKEATETLDWLRNNKSIQNLQLQEIKVYTGCLN